MIAWTARAVFSKMISLMGEEARLAGRSVVKMIILAIFSGILLVSIWFSVLAMIFIYFSSILLSPYLSLLIIILLNILLLLFISIIMRSTKKKLFFNELRKEIADLQK
jgi:asparagine N-glycosylation enzyme membrane subunit Stt3